MMETRKEKRFRLIERGREVGFGLQRNGEEEWKGGFSLTRTGDMICTKRKRNRRGCL